MKGSACAKMDRPRMARKFVKQKNVCERLQKKDDHELFLSAFEKPTHIYRYLATRHSESPIFLHRNLTYMMGYRMSRKKNTRYLGLNYIVDKLNEFYQKRTAMLNLKFLEFVEEKSAQNSDIVEIETYLIKRNNDKPVIRTLIGKHKIQINSENHDKINNKEICIFINDLRNDDISSCALQFRVKIPSVTSVTRYGRTAKMPTFVTKLSSEIIFLRKHNLFLTEGLYEIAFDENSNKENQSGMNNCQWQSSESSSTEENIKFSAYLKLDVTTTGLHITRNDTKLNKKERFTSDKPIIYQFLYGNYSQKTNASFLPNCPWCSVDCGSMYSLLKHLRLCHERLCFKYTKTIKEHRITVKVNDLFDGSQETGPFGYNFSESNSDIKPKRKYSWTKILIFRSKKPEPSMTEFTKFLDPEENTLVEGHHRLYYHSVSGIPMFPQEITEDSEDENDPLWLRDSVVKMVDDFRDVNDGEKQIMKMWNLHVLKYGFVGNGQMELACNMFVEEKGHQIISKNLYKNFMLHLANLVDYEVVTARIVLETGKKLQEIMKMCDRDLLEKLMQSSVKNAD